MIIITLVLLCNVLHWNAHIVVTWQAKVGLMAAGCYGMPQFRMRCFLFGACSEEVHVPWYLVTLLICNLSWWSCLLSVCLLTSYLSCRCYHRTLCPHTKLKICVVVYPICGRWDLIDTLKWKTLVLLFVYVIVSRNRNCHNLSNVCWLQRCLVGYEEYKQPEWLQDPLVLKDAFSDLPPVSTLAHLFIVVLLVILGLDLYWLTAIWTRLPTSRTRMIFHMRMSHIQHSNTSYAYPSEVGPG